MEPDILIARYLQGSATVNEQQQLLEWMRMSEDNKAYYMQIKRVADYCASVSSAESYDVDAAIANFDHKHSTTIVPAKSNKVKRLVLWSSSVAAAIALIVGVYVLQPQNEDYILSATASSDVTEIQLPDKSTITLNKHAKLFRNEHFADVRTVRLNGEAFFSVTHDANHPFIVESDDLKIKVLGTEFNVHPSNDNQFITVTVESGRVMVMYNKESVIINKGEQAIYIKKDHSLHKSANVNENFDSWKTGKLYFNDTPLRDVVSQLNEHYGVEYSIGSQSLDSCRLNASFDFKDVNKVSEFLSIMLKVDIKNENNKLVLYERETK